jgi:crotonobetainyl-CoA:carnitine CoA-transferase CaiB-like acyl-CoA transferase
MTQLLNDIKIVEVAIYGFVPSAAAALSDWGAQVIKVEHPETGDPVHGLSAYGINPGDGGVTPLWEVFNRGKQSVGIDIATGEGLELLMKLVDEADVFLTNFMGSARKRLGIDVDAIMARNPRIIYGRGTGHGPIGPDAEKGGFDAVSYWSRPGASISAIAPGGEWPVLMPGPAFGDLQAGLHLAGGVVAALYQREKTGKGSVVDVSLLGSGLWAMQASIAGCYVKESRNIDQLDRARPPNPLANIYRTKDRQYFVLGMLESDKYWKAFCAAIGEAGLATHPDFADSRLRAANSESCVSALDAIFEKMTLEAVAAALGGQEGQWSVIAAPGDAINDRQALENDYIQFVEYPNGAKLPLVPLPTRVDGQEVTLRPAPGHAEHTDEVLTGLGKTLDELIELKVAGIIS